MSEQYVADIQQAKDIISGSVPVWNAVTCQVLRAIGTWRENDAIDWASIANEAIYKAALSYKPKRKFVNHAIHVTRNMLCQAFRHRKVRANTMSCSLDQIPDKVDHQSDMLDQLIAKEDAMLLLEDNANSYVMTQLILAGNSRAEAARVMQINRFKSHSIITKMRERLGE